MNIIEKLGITPGPWGEESTSVGSPERTINIGSETESICSFSQPKNAKLIAAAPEMLEALIEYCYSSDVFESSMRKNGLEIKPDSLRFNAILPIIEKATGRTWPEIKELL